MTWSQVALREGLSDVDSYVIFIEAIFAMKLGILGGWTIFICHNNPDPVKGQMIAAYTITTITVIIFMAIVCHQDSRKLFNRKTLLMEVAVLPIVCYHF